MGTLRAALAAGGLIISLLLTACATAPQTAQLLASAPALPPKQELTQVAFFPQQRYQCGPAALATVLDASGVSVSAAELVDEVYVPARHGALQLELLAGSRRHGRIPYPIQPQLVDLLQELAAGNPVLVLQNLALSWAPQWHYAVAVGYDLGAGEIILRSGRERRHRLPLSTFERTWARGGYWGVVVLPPTRLPATAQARPYLRAVVGLEQARRWREALLAYRTALQRWPDNLLARMGLGNSAYALGDKAMAEAAFREALRRHPQAAAAHNNLAQLLLEQGLLDEARQHAQRAVALGGPQQDLYRQTLATIEQRRGAISPAD
jgi:hypothetical protein